MIKQVFVILFSLLLIGCANTITQTEKIYQLQFKINFEGSVNLNNYNYYLVFQKNPNVSIEPNQIEDLDGRIYFPTPGLRYDLELMNDQDRTVPDSTFRFYYSTLFSTWSEYIVIQKETSTSSSQFLAKLFQSGSTGFTRKTNSATDDSTYNEDHDPKTPFAKDQQYLLSYTGNTIILTFDIDLLELKLLDRLSFFIFTTKRTAPGQTSDISGSYLDYIQSPQQFKLELQKEAKNNESNNLVSLDPGADIISWEVQVF